MQGVKFEPNSFKLTHEMVVLMGGRTSQGYQLFQQLTVKAFLAIRPHADQLVSTVQLMLDTCLPSFKGEPTIRRLKERFALHLNERQAAEFMMSIVRNAYENVRSTVYDEFQRVCVPVSCTMMPLLTCLIASKWHTIQVGEMCSRGLRGYLLSFTISRSTFVDSSVYITMDDGTGSLVRFGRLERLVSAGSRELLEDDRFDLPQHDVLLSRGPPI